MKNFSEYVDDFMMLYATSIEYKKFCKNTWPSTAVEEAYAKYSNGFFETERELTAKISVTGYQVFLDRLEEA